MHARPSHSAWPKQKAEHKHVASFHWERIFSQESDIDAGSGAPESIASPFSSGAVASHTAPCLRTSSGPRRGAVGRLTCTRTKEGRRIENARTPAGLCACACNANTVSFSALKTRLWAVVDLRPSIGAASERADETRRDKAEPDGTGRDGTSIAYDSHCHVREGKVDQR